MLKLMKYEFRKLRTTLLCLLGALVALEVLFVVGINADKGNLVGISLALLSLLAFLVYAYIILAGMASYSRELKEKSGYLIFMAPVSPLGVVLSKLLFTALAALAATALFGLAAYLDYAHLMRRLNVDETLVDQINYFLRMATGNAGLSVRGIGSMALFTTATILIEVLLTMCTAYLAITLSATLLQNKKGFLRGLISLALFLALTWGCNWLAQKLLYDRVEIDATLSQLTATLGWSFLLNAVLCALFAGVSAWLLDRKVNL